MEEIKEEVTQINENNESFEKPKKEKYLRLKYRTKENDIRYKGPLSYRSLRMLGWFFLSFAPISMLLGFMVIFDPYNAQSYTDAQGILGLFSPLPLALFMLANFGIILRNRKNFKYLFIFYGGVMAMMYIVANLIVLHYVYGLLRTINSGVSFQAVALLVGMFLSKLGTSGYMFNLFVDLFLCVLTVYFMFYVPKNKVFAGKKVIFFRMMVIIPVAYEVASLVLKHYALIGEIIIPSYFFFLLTSKPPLTFAAFFIITLIVKIREYTFLKKYDFNYELLEEHNSTNAHSLRTSISIAIVFNIIFYIDIIALIIYCGVQYMRLGGTQEALQTALNLGQGIGLGGSVSLGFIAPLALLYSYTRVHKSKKIDSFLPFIGIAFIIFVFIEGMYLGLRFAIPEWKKTIAQWLEAAEQQMQENEFDFEGLERALLGLIR